VITSSVSLRAKRERRLNLVDAVRRAIRCEPGVWEVPCQGSCREDRVVHLVTEWLGENGLFLSCDCPSRHRMDCLHRQAVDIRRGRRGVCDRCWDVVPRLWMLEYDGVVVGVYCSQCTRALELEFRDGRERWSRYLFPIEDLTKEAS
jgi:hypothetical protein